MSELSRSLQPRHVTMISIGGIIGAGLFVGSSASIAATGPAIVLSYLITGTLVLLVMRMLGEMAVMLPAVRSFTEFARVGLGPWAGFVAGWLYWYFWIIVVPVEAIAGATILHGWLGLPSWLLGLVLMGVMTGVNLMSARSYGEFEFWFASIKVAAILVFIALATAFACGFTSPSGPTFANLTRYGGFVPKGWVSVLAGAVTVYFSLTGAEITTIAAAESREPARAVARMSSSVIVRILTFYVGSVLLIVTVVPWIEVRPGESPFTLALTTMHFRWASLAMSAIILTAVLSCLNSAFYVCSRVLFVLAEHGDAPQWLVRLNVRRVPTRSVWVGSLAGVFGILAAINYPQTVFAFLVNASGALMVFIYMMVALAHIRLRRAREARGEPPPALTMWLFPWSSYAAVGGMAAVLIAMALTPGELTTELRISVVALAVAAIAFFIVDARRRARLIPATPPADHS
jgi:L-asparagine transporter-like permease